ncbi:MAG: DUF4143 domain-containing protein [Acidobacteriota bacterium]|jgi:predicted AAA+ superfamily ATPase|nr:DUF4143 domain-containing protein [Acidobacteriota bacterium]
MLERRLARSLTAFRHSFFLWGARHTGKSALLRQTFPDAPYYDLHSAAEFRRLGARPAILSEECAGRTVDGGAEANQSAPPVIVDGIHKLPGLLGVIHRLIAEKGLRFILVGENPRRLARGGGGIPGGLGGRALRRELLPLTSAEIPGFSDISLARALNRGLLPPHYLAESQDAARAALGAYAGDYLREEALAEGQVRNPAAFQRFLEMAALANGDIVNYAVIGRECGVSAKTVASYFGLLSDTLVGVWVPAWTKGARRRVIGAPRFYLFDVGFANELLHRGGLAAGSPEHGAAFGHFIFMELRAYAAYARRAGGLSWWQTAGGVGIDFVLGDNDVALDVTDAETATSDRLKGLRSHRGEFHPRRSILVCRAPCADTTGDGVEILPWREFLGLLWSGGIW